ncbi:hypothetical protein D3C81_1772800 [compost metagenome]
MVIVTQSCFRRTGQRRGIDDQFRFLRTGVNQAICQHQTAFGVGVHHFNIFAVAIANDIAELEGIAADQVIRAAQIQLHTFVQTASDGKRQSARYRGRAAHIGLH